MYYSPLSLASNFIYFFQWFIFANSVFAHRRKRLIIWLTELVIFALIVILGSELSYMSFFRFAFFPMLVTGGFLFIFREKWYRLLIFSLVMYIVSFMTEFLVGMFLYTPEVLAGYLDEQPLSLQLQIGISCTFISSVFIWSLFLWTKRSAYKLSTNRWILCIAFLICQLIIIHSFVREICNDPNDENTFYFVLSIVSCLAMDGFLVMFILSLSKAEWLRAENKFLSSQVDAQHKYYATLTGQYENVRRMRHDIAKHLNAMEGLVAGEKHAEATEYIAGLKQRISSIPAGLCENPAVDALLLLYKERAAQEGTGLELCVSLPADCGIEDQDLVCVFGNLLDNALEACRGLTNPLVKLSCAAIKGYFVITVENPIESKPKDKARDPGRGTGTRILRHIAGKYEGEYSAAVEKDRFFARISLKMGGD